jgi:hypothetical protein
MNKLTAKALFQRERDRLETRRTRLHTILEDIHREQQRLESEAQELDVAERVLGRLETEAEIKVLPYTPPVVRRGQISSETDAFDLALKTDVSKLERA